MKAFVADSLIEFAADDGRRVFQASCFRFECKGRRQGSGARARGGVLRRIAQTGSTFPDFLLEQ